ncbi:MAG: preprotein translocase subunit SecG [Clostridia bacterium]|jgi:preprotein translocase subunit SecG|nr:preprotein translocase subunit SecG [Clostridia bacterium]
MTSTMAIAYIVLAVITTILVITQPAKDAGMGSTISGSSDDSYFGKNKGNTVEEKLKRVTGFFIVVFILTTIFMTQYLNTEKGSYKNPEESAVKNSENVEDLEPGEVSNEQKEIVPSAEDIKEELEKVKAEESEATEEKEEENN